MSKVLIDRAVVEQEPVGDVLRGRICGYTPGMSRIEVQLPEGTLITGWLELGETVYIAAEAPQPAKPAEQEPIAPAMATVIATMQADPEYAWSWHCNIAMAFVDAGGDHYTANQGAARFMKLLANVEPAHDLPAAPQPAKREQAVEQEPTTHKLVLKSVHELAAELYAQHPTYRGTKPLAWVEVRHTVRREWLDKASAMLAAALEAPQPAKREPQQELLDLLKWLDQIGGLGLTVHERISAAIAAYERKNGIGGQV